MKQRCIIVIMFICLMPCIAKAQWTFDILSVEAYINDHKKQRSLLLARSTLEHSNKLLHEYTADEVGGYKKNTRRKTDGYQNLSKFTKGKVLSLKQPTLFCRYAYTYEQALGTRRVHERHMFSY